MSKSATKVALNNLYYFDKKTQTLELTYDQITRAAKFITRANERNKTIGNKQSKTLLTAIAAKIKSSKNGEIFIDHDWISTITDCKPEQNTKIMGQLADILDFKYRRSVIFEGKKRHYGLIVKFTHDGQKRLTNPELFYDVPLPQKAQKTSKVTPKKNEVITEKNRSSYKYIRDAIEEIPLSYAKGGISESSIITTETNTPARDPIQKNQQNQHATFAPCSLTQLEQVALTKTEEKHQLVTNCSQLTSQEEKSQSVTNCHDFNASEEKAIELERKTRSEEATGLFAMSDLMAKVLKEPQKTEEMPEMKLEELPKLTEKEERAILLSRALWQTFGEERSGEIQDDYKFVEITPQKVCIQTKEMRLNDIEKAKIRKCINSVYGEDVTIAMQVLAPASKEPMPSNENVQLPTSKANSLIFKSKLLTYNMQQMFNYPVEGVVKVIEAHGKIIVDTVAFLIERMTAPGAIDDLEQAVVETGLTLELHTRRVNHEFKNFQKDAIVLTPEKILKDREWLENKRKSLQELEN